MIARKVCYWWCWLVAFQVPMLYGLELHPDQVRWQSLEFAAGQTLIPVQATVSLSEVSAAELSDRLVVPPQGKSLEATGKTISLHTVNNSLGRKTDVQLWMRAADGQALQRERLNTGSKSRYKLYRYLADRVYAERREPASGEEQKPPAQWSGQRSTYYPFSGLEQGAALVDPSALLYILAAADLHKSGDSIQLPVFTDSQVSQVSARVIEQRSYQPGFDRGGKEGNNTEPRTGLVIELSARSAGNQQLDEDFRLLGLEGVITVLLDQEDRIPVAVSGNVEFLGQVTIALQRVTLR